MKSKKFQVLQKLETFPIIIINTLIVCLLVVFQVLDMVKILSKISIKPILRIHLIVILGNAFNFEKTIVYKNMKNHL